MKSPNLGIQQVEQPQRVALHCGLIPCNGLGIIFEPMGSWWRQATFICHQLWLVMDMLCHCNGWSWGKGIFWSLCFWSLYCWVPSQSRSISLENAPLLSDELWCVGLGYTKLKLRAGINIHVCRLLLCVPSVLGVLSVLLQSVSMRTGPASLLDLHWVWVYLTFCFQALRSENQSPEERSDGAIAKDNGGHCEGQHSKIQKRTAEGHKHGCVNMCHFYSQRISHILNESVSTLGLDGSAEGCLLEPDRSFQVFSTGPWEGIPQQGRQNICRLGQDHAIASSWIPSIITVEASPMPAAIHAIGKQIRRRSGPHWHVDHWCYTNQIARCRLKSNRSASVNHAADSKAYHASILGTDRQGRHLKVLPPE